MATTFLVVVLFKVVAIVPVLRDLHRALHEWFIQRAWPDAQKEQELWYRARWDFDVAKKLRRRLVRHAGFLAMMRREASRLLDEHPEWQLLQEKWESRAQGKIMELDETVQRIFGGWKGAA
jgi:hypothetical protein